MRFFEILVHLYLFIGFTTNLPNRHPEFIEGWRSLHHSSTPLRVTAYAPVYRSTAKICRTPELDYTKLK